MADPRQNVEQEISRGTIREDEYHPAAGYALSYIQNTPIKELLIFQESFSSIAISGNRLAEICSETLRRILHSEPVSDRYVLGLSWTMANIEELEERDTSEKQ